LCFDAFTWFNARLAFLNDWVEALESWLL